jgi:hypothetical protein
MAPTVPAAFTTPYNPLAKWEDANGIRKFSNAKLQSAIDDALKALPADAHAAFVAHHVFEQNGAATENITKVSAFVKGPAGFSLAVAGYKDWHRGDIGAEAKLVKVF